MIVHIFGFAIAVLMKWQVFLTGGFIVALVFIIEHWRRPGNEWKHLRSYIRIYIPASLLVSFFLVWNDQRIRSETLDETKVGPIVNVRRSYESLPGLARGIVWFQVGKHALWSRQIEAAELDKYLARWPRYNRP